jgi:TonB-linked SusC/RagA family outer membrane protein
MRKIFLFFSVLLLISSALKAQNRTITGVVTGDKSETLPGVTIQIKGSNVSTATDANGKFSIVATDLQSVVVTAKYLGYTYQEKTLRQGEMNADFKLVPVANDLSEVVVTGYGDAKKSTLTGAVSTIDLKKVEDIPALSLTAALRGTVPGLSVSGGVQRPGQPTTITVRNPVAFAKDGGQGTNPLFVIDDIIRTQADFDLLDINEVESVTVLKDAEAAIYGVQGANGVVMVRTKKGKMGAPKIAFSTSVGASNATQLPKMLNSVQLATFNNDYNNTNLYQQTTAGIGTPLNNYYNDEGFKFVNGVQTTDPRLAAWYTPDEMAYFQDHSHNWMKEAFKTSYVEREALNVTGGNDKTTYFIGGDYVNQNSNFKGINSYKYGVRANIETKPVKGLTATMSLSDDIFYTRSYFYKVNSTTESLDNDAGTLENMMPWNEYFINGNPVLLGSSATGGYDNVNFFLIQNSNNYTGTTNYVMNILGKLTYETPIKGLTGTVTMNKNINSSNSKQFGTSFNYYKYSGQGENGHIPGGTLQSISTIKNGDRVRLNPVFATSYQLDAGINYNRTFGKNAISFLALYEQREQNSEGVAAESDGVVAGGLDYQTFTAGPLGSQTSTQSSQVSQFGFLSFISRLNYSYDSKYLLQLVYRRDGSSRFAPGQNWGGFPAASVGWVASEEPFIKNNFNWIDLLKFRVSAGLTGTDNTNPYQYATSYNLGTGSSGGGVFNETERSTAIKPNVAIANANVTWDHIFKMDYGMDAQFLKNRLSVTADYFFSHGYDLLTALSSSVPATIGFANVPSENFSTVNMFGYEISAGWRDHIGKKFTYSFTPFFSWSDNKNIKIDVASGNIGGPLDLTGLSSDAGNYGYKSEGLIRTQDQANAIIAARSALAGGNTKVTIFGTALQPGMINYQDYNNDGIIDAKDQQYLTKKSSNHNNLGLNFSVGYGGLNLNVIMGMSWGGWASIDGLKPFQQSSSGASIADNRPVYWADHWTKTNTDATYPAPYFQSDYQVTTDFWLVRATSLNVSSANLSYSIPQKFMSKIGIASARFYVVATNPVQFINPFPDGYRDFSTGLYVYPALRTVSLGLNVGF